MIGEATKAELQPLPNAKKILAPNISHVVDDVKGRYFLTSLIHVFGLTGPHPAKPVLTNFIRLVDKSAFEYEQARRAMKRYARRPSQRLERVGLLLRSADHLESCVNALYRAGRAAETLRRAQSVPPIAKGEVLTKAEMELLAALRNFAEHIDEKIVDEEVGQAGRASCTTHAPARSSMRDAPSRMHTWRVSSSG